MVFQLLTEMIKFSTVFNENSKCVVSDIPLEAICNINPICQGVPVTAHARGGGLSTPPLKSHLGLFLGDFFNTNQNIYKIVGYMKKIVSKTSKTVEWQPF